MSAWSVVVEAHNCCNLVFDTFGNFVADFAADIYLVVFVVVEQHVAHIVLVCTVMAVNFEICKSHFHLHQS